MKIKKAIRKFEDLAIRKQKCRQDKISISIKNNEASNEVSFSIFFMGYEDSKKIKSLYIFLPIMSACSK